MKKIFLFVLLTIVSLSCYSHADFTDPVATCAGVTDIPETECQTLLSFYNAMDGDNWTDHSNRGDTGNVASWHGIALSLGSVTQINLGYNNLSGGLSGNILSGLNSLQILSLPSNSINNIEINTFAGLSSLTTLDLSYNQITNLPNGVFADLSGLLYLTITSNQISMINENTRTGLVSLTSLELSSNQISSITGGIFSGLDSLTYLGLGSNQITTLSSGTFHGLSSLTDLHLGHNQIIIIDNGYWNELLSLTYLNLYGNQIATLTTGMFSGLDSLTTLGLGGNQITTINSAYWNGLDSLQNLQLDNNLITTLGNGSFSNLSSLTHLDLSVNQITSIDDNDFVGLGSLTSLNLSNNQITTIGNNTFTELSFMDTLYLNNNQITTINSGAFTGLSSLTTLTLHNNQITSLDNGDFAGLSSLAILYLNDNQIASIQSNTFSGVSSLTNLNLSTNQIADVSDIDFHGLTSLSQLTLSYNPITTLSSGDFNELPSLTNLLIEFTQISSLSHGDFHGLTSLTNLGLAANQIITIQSDAFDGLSSLISLYLNNNQITTINSGAFDGLSSLQYLYLNSNQITSLNNNTFDGLNSLQGINLADNQVSAVTNETFSGITNLTNLNLNSNRIVTLETGVFAGNPSLTYLALSTNCLDEFALDPLVVSFLATKNFSDRASQMVCPTISYDPSTTGAGPVTGTIAFTGGLAANRNILSSNNPTLPYYVRVGNYDHAFDISSLSDNNLLRHTDITGSVTWMIDTIAPTATLEYSPSSGSWTSGNVLVTFTGESEPLTGFDSTGYIFTGNGTHDVVFGDAAGNTGSITATVSWIDRIAPALQSVTLSGGVQASSPVTIAWEVTDDHAVSSVQVMVADDTGATNILSSGDVVFADIPLATGYIQPTGLGNGHYYYYLIIHDTAGNETISSIYDFNYIDTVAPTATISYDISSRTSGDVVATITGASETLTGLNVTGYTFTGNGNFLFTFEDFAGNTGATTATVTWIDKESPTFTGIVNNGIYSGNVIINMTDNNTGVSATIDSSIYTGTQVYTNGAVLTDYGTYTLTITDLAGNTTGATFIISRYMVAGDSCFDSLIGSTAGPYADDFERFATQNNQPNFQTFLINQVGYTGGSDRGNRFVDRWAISQAQQISFIDFYISQILAVRYNSTDIGSVHTSCGISSNTGNSNTGSQNIVTPPSGGGGPGSLRRDICLGGDHSDSYYDGLCTGNSTGTLSRLSDIGNNSPDTSGGTESTKAYRYAFDHGITTQKTKQRARLSDPLTRAELAKMLSVYAMTVMDQKPDTTMRCRFDDIADQTKEMRGYIKTACQLGLMGVDIASFNPNGIVTRADFGTAFSRLLRGEKYNKTGELFYSKHLRALKKEKIMNNIDPTLVEIRGYVMLMMLRADTNN